MEPISALGLAATCTSLLSSIVKITSALHEFREKFKSAELAILSLGTQLATLQASISELTIILSSQVSTINQRTRLLETLHDALSSTSLVISYISDEFTETTKFTTEPSTVFRADRWVRAKFVFSESGLAPMKEALRDQIQAIHLLLSIATIPTEDDQAKLLSDAESIRTLASARHDGSSSLLGHRDPDSRASINSDQSDTMSRLGVTFSFDGLILVSKPYREAVAATWRTLKSQRQDSVTAEASLESPRKDSVTVEVSAPQPPIPPIAFEAPSSSSPTLLSERKQVLSPTLPPERKQIVSPALPSEKKKVVISTEDSVGARQLRWKQSGFSLARGGPGSANTVIDY